MRCPQCEKFVPFSEGLDTSEVEVFELNGLLIMSGTVYRTCGDCGENLQQAEVEAKEELSSVFEETEDDDEAIYEVGDPSFEMTERLEDTGKNGKKIKNHRYMKKFIRVSADVPVTKTVGSEKFEGTIELSWECRASGFEDC